MADDFARAEIRQPMRRVAAQSVSVSSASLALSRWVVSCDMVSVK